MPGTLSQASGRSPSLAKRFNLIETEEERPASVDGANDETPRDFLVDDDDYVN
jgi:hypothetical protein